MSLEENSKGASRNTQAVRSSNWPGELENTDWTFVN